MRVEDLHAVMAIAERVHPAFPEDAAVFAERLALCPQGCFVAEVRGRVVGYLISHPWRCGAPPALNARLGALPGPAECWYLHDLALLPEARGGGLGRAALALVEDAARAARLGSIELVAISGSAPFWARLGFAPLASRPGAAVPASYGADACAMRRTIARTVAG
ncbi:GNAT family N-acetyltransferase [Faunimonas sp. B44]|uniref:GNAT family N-acetyltransferase n=1 Tax=Faunimonas sp. B44 TaxID=3461493 RepID=UPI0040449FEA